MTARTMAAASSLPAVSPPVSGKADILFSLDRHNYHHGVQAFRGRNRQEYYTGDFSIAESGTIDVRSERKVAGRFSIIRQRSRNNLHFRRTWKHIRQDGMDLTILWFVRFGTMVFSDQNGSKTAQAGDFVMTRSSSPFLIACEVDKDEVHEVLHATVPSHVLRKYLSHELNVSILKSSLRGEYAMCAKILTSVFEDPGSLAEDSVSLLAEAALRIVGIALSQQPDGRGLKPSIKQRRVRDALRYIDIHLADPNLTHGSIANACNISPRYLTQLLSEQGMSFKQLVWRARLEKAKAWLANSDPRDISISEIAFALGFKSAAHFTRLFTRTFNGNPRDFRKPSMGLGSFGTPPSTWNTNVRQLPEAARAISSALPATGGLPDHAPKWWSD